MHSPKGVPGPFLLGVCTCLLVVMGCRQEQPSKSNAETGDNWKQVTVFIPELI
jgi:hypothetical protein